MELPSPNLCRLSRVVYVVLSPSHNVLVFDGSRGLMVEAEACTRLKAEGRGVFEAKSRDLYEARGQGVFKAKDRGTKPSFV